MKSTAVCEWEEEADGEYWETSCNEAHCFITDGPKENNYQYCPYCGKILKEKP
jgi:hypothetical protein